MRSLNALKVYRVNLKPLGFHAQTQKQSDSDNFQQFNQKTKL